MEIERWQRVESLFQAAYELPPANRAKFLRDASNGDETLEREVQSLLAAHQDAGSFLDRPAIELGERASLPLGLTGQTISHYKVLEQLGAGGMGVVYKAFDTKLDRLVALKFLPPQMRHNLELKRRLTEEVRAASALDHSNIVVIYEIDETPQGDVFIAMAYHDGATLREKIGRDNSGYGLQVIEALQIARHIASGLAKAHERGIFHRNISPSNILVANDGIARIIGFGLTKSIDGTVTIDGTTKGTPFYMSPEQASGRTVDSRTDLWSLGVVLYEMLAGRLPFTGDTYLQVIRAIVTDAPPNLRGLRPALPADVVNVVTRALEKDVSRRRQSAADMVRELTVSIASLDSSPRRSKYLNMTYAIPALMLVFLIAAAIWYYERL